MDTQPNKISNVGFKSIFDSRSTQHLHLTALFLSLCKGEIIHAAVVGKPMTDGTDISAHLEDLHHSDTDMEGVLCADNGHTVAYGNPKERAAVSWNGGFQANFVIDEHGHFIACARSVPPAIADGLKQSTMVDLSLTMPEFLRRGKTSRPYEWKGQFDIKTLTSSLVHSVVVNNPAAMYGAASVRKNVGYWTEPANSEM